MVYVYMYKRKIAHKTQKLRGNMKNPKNLIEMTYEEWKALPPEKKHEESCPVNFMGYKSIKHDLFIVREDGSKEEVLIIREKQ